MSELFVVRSKIKDCVKDCNVSSDFADALSKHVEKTIVHAVERCKENGRKTLRPCDI